MHITLSKIHGGCVPADQQTSDFLDKVKYGDLIHSDFKKMRNGKFHRKLFALLNTGFEYWEPGEIDCRFGCPEKNFEQFMDDTIILAGFFVRTFGLDGRMKIRRKSISFANMDDTEFEKLYNAVLAVLMKNINVLGNMSEDEINALVDKYLGFV